MKAVIFDMDGVISDTQKFHSLAESKILENYNINLDPKEITSKFAGVSDRDFFHINIQEHNLKNINTTALIQQKWNIMSTLINNIEPIPGALELVFSLKKAGFKLAIASSSTHLFINKVLNKLSIKSKFNTIVSGEDIKHGKPAPDIFLLAAKKINTNYQNCLVVEDGKNGIIAAKKAGMKCIALVNDLNNPACNIVDHATTSLSNLSPTLINDLIDN